MLKAHFDAVERAILVTSEIPANAGHPLNRGTPRATFIRKFLGQHISNRVSIGCGEIIDAFSVPGDKRNQIDIVIFRNDYPRIHLRDDIQAFLAVPAVADQVDPFAHPDALRRFRVVENLEELQRALEYPWEKWAVFLHPSQRNIIEESFSGPARVAGSAGTGKTVVALHRAARLAQSGTEARVPSTLSRLPFGLRWR